MNRCLFFLLLPLISLGSTSASAQEKAIDVSGKWQICWEARIGTERGLVQLRQSGREVTGLFEDRPGAPRISGHLEGRNIAFRVEFPGSHPFTMAFSGLVNGDVMAGKFDLQGMQDGYDWHGENARPTNYSWTASRQPGTEQPLDSPAAQVFHPWLRPQ